MPLSPHRPALAGILLAFVVGLSLAAGSMDASAGTSTSYDPIARTALSYEGTYQGECWPFVRRVVLEATGKAIGFDYRLGFFEAGATEVSAADARSGDIIQIANDGNTAPDADYPGLHTSIVLDNLGNGLFNVIDSNWKWDGIVRQRPGYRPADMAAAQGLNYHIYRITGSPGSGGPGSASTSSAPAAPAPLKAGDLARVSADGDGLNFRTEPGLGGAKIGLLPDGSVVKVLGSPVTAGGRDWVQVQVNGLNGWVAAQYLVNISPSVPASSSTSGPQAVRPFRAFVPMLATGD